VADYTYDANNRITSLTHNHGATLITGFTHQYDDEGNKFYEEQQHNPTRSEAYAYDSIYRLVDYKVGPLVAGTVAVPVTQTAYNLDAVGNWDSKTTDAVIETRTHNAANEIEQTEVSGQVSAISHDANGNLIQDANYDYTFDENNRLIQVVSPPSSVISQYAYDALGRRISKVVGSATTVFLYDNARIIEERDGSNNVQVTYTYGNYIDEALTKDAGSDRYYYHQNTLWSVHALTDAAGAVVERYAYDAYGQITILDPSFLPLSSAPLAYFTFTGREYDGETGLYHYRARTFGPGLGRFLSRDPLGYVDGMNLYQYVRGMPTIRADPFGMTCSNVGAVLVPLLAQDPTTYNHVINNANINSGGAIYTLTYTGVWEEITGAQHLFMSAPGETVSYSFTLTNSSTQTISTEGPSGSVTLTLFEIIEATVNSGQSSETSDSTTSDSATVTRSYAMPSNLHCECAVEVSAWRRKMGYQSTYYYPYIMDWSTDTWVLDPNPPNYNGGSYNLGYDTFGLKAVVRDIQTLQ
jgi:RHS repeat-associated protein